VTASPSAELFSNRHGDDAPPNQLDFASVPALQFIAYDLLQK
jgi:hypothetical protein